MTKVHLLSPGGDLSADARWVLGHEAQARRLALQAALFAPDGLPMTEVPSDDDQGADCR